MFPPGLGVKKERGETGGRWLSSCLPPPKSLAVLAMTSRGQGDRAQRKKARGEAR